MSRSFKFLELYIGQCKFVYAKCEQVCIFMCHCIFDRDFGTGDFSFVLWLVHKGLQVNVTRQYRGME